MTPGSIQGKTEADQVAPYLLRPVYEWTDGELQREITKHKAALDSLADDVPADRKALERHLTEYREELESREKARRKPIDASTVLRGIYRSVLDTELGHYMLTEEQGRSCAEWLEHQMPNWMVIYGPVSRNFIAFPKFLAPPRTFMVGSHPGVMISPMKELERRFMPPDKSILAMVAEALRKAS
jgi:hypothetical protein